MEYRSVEDIMEMPGLRLVLTQGKPGPWGEAAKAIFTVKGISYVAAAQNAGQENPQLLEWTGQDSAPVAIYDNEKPCISWEEILYLAERLAPAPSLIPEDAMQRALMFGLCREIVGEMGFGWCRRLMILDEIMGLVGLEEIASRLGYKYRYSKSDARKAPDKIVQILQRLSEQLLHQREQGSRFFIGKNVSVLDLYWATFSNMLHPLSPQDCAMGDDVRYAYTVNDSRILAAADEILIEHRDYIFSGLIGLPMDF